VTTGGTAAEVYLSPAAPKLQRGRVHNARMARARRVRGRLLRLILNRPIAVVVGAALALPGAVLLLKDYTWESGVTDGLALVLLATGAAILWTGIHGRQPDWID
jgi:hypothetical protein